MGVAEILSENDQAVIDDANECLRWIRRIDWSRTSQENRLLPGHCNEITPTFVDGGDWVEWDAAAWRPVGNPPVVAEYACRTLVRHGPTDNMIQQGFPMGRAGRQSSRAARRTYRPSFVTLGDQRVAERVLWRYLDHYEALSRALAAHNDDRRPLNFEEFIDILRRTVVDERQPMVADTNVAAAGPASAGTADAVAPATDDAATSAGAAAGASGAASGDAIASAANAQ